MSGAGLLLDTHAALWWIGGDQRLPTPTRQAISEAGAVHVSAASTWEVAIKVALAKLTVKDPEGSSFATACKKHGFQLVDLTHADAEAVADLPPARRDPFDRLLAATARRRGWTLVTADPAFTVLGVPTLWRA